MPIGKVTAGTGGNTDALPGGPFKLAPSAVASWCIAPQGLQPRRIVPAPGSVSPVILSGAVLAPLCLLPGLSNPASLLLMSPSSVCPSLSCLCLFPSLLSLPSEVPFHCPLTTRFPPDVPESLPCAPWSRCVTPASLRAWPCRWAGVPGDELMPRGTRRSGLPATSPSGSGCRGLKAADLGGLDLPLYKVYVVPLPLDQIHAC